MSHIACSTDCAIALATKKRKKSEKLDTRRRKEKLKSRSDWIKEAQTAFNAWVRGRDRDSPCISCQRFHTGQNHAGHYRSTAAAPQLRFDEENVHLQCAPCNNHKSGNVVEYRINLVKKIGLQSVERLEADNTVRKWTVEELKQIKSEYRAKLRALVLARQDQPGLVP